MDLSKIQPIPNEPALFIKNKKILVIADLHIGIENELREHGVNAQNHTQKMMDHFISLCRKYKPKEIILLGDIKHNIPSSTIRERIDVKNFLETIKKYGVTHIVPGNHDGNISRISPSDVIIHPSNGYLLENIGFIHGHRWPSNDIMKTDQIIMAHTHPMIMLIDRLNHRSFEPCWVKTCFIEKKLKEKYHDSSNPQLLIIPAFNPLCGGIPINKDKIVGPLGKIINLDNAEIYLLDGTLLGTIKNVKLKNQVKLK